MTDQTPAAGPLDSVPTLFQNLERAYAQKLVSILLGAMLLKLGAQMDEGMTTILTNLGVALVLAAVSFVWTHLHELKATKRLEAAMNGAAVVPPVALT